MIFETPRLVIRPWALEDAEAGFAIYGDPEVTRYVTGDGAAASSVDAVRRQLEVIVQRASRGDHLGFWAIERRDDGSVIGTAAMVPLENRGPEIEIGWHLARAAWGLGFASETGVGLLRHGFETLGHESLLAVVHPENERSLRVCDRIGMRSIGSRMYEGHLEEFFVAERASWSAPALLPG